MSQSWLPALAVAGTASSGQRWDTADGGMGGFTLAMYLGVIDGILARTTFPVSATGNVKVLVNFGANEVVLGMPTGAQWKADYQALINKVVAKWPDCKVYIAKAWRRYFDVSCATLAGWVDEVIAANPGVCFVGHNEPTWLKGGDDGATMTTDGVHYSEAGQTECAAQWKTILGW